MKNKNVPKCAQWVQGIHWRKRFFLGAPKPILGPIWGPFWLHWAPGAKFGGVKMPKSSTSGSRPRGRQMALPWPLVAFVVLLGTQVGWVDGRWGPGLGVCPVYFWLGGPSRPQIRPQKLKSTPNSFPQAPHKGPRWPHEPKRGRVAPTAATPTKLGPRVELWVYKYGVGQWAIWRPISGLSRISAF